jgi:hypothetical protein
MATVLELETSSLARLRLYAVVTLGLVLMGFALAESARQYKPLRESKFQPAPVTATSADRDVEGTVVVADTLDAVATDVWPFRLTGLVHARVTLQVDNPNNVECRLLDPEGRRVTLARFVTDRCRFAWTPSRTGAYRLEIENLTGAALPYVIRTRQMGVN